MNNLAKALDEMYLKLDRNELDVDNINEHLQMQLKSLEDRIQTIKVNSKEKPPKKQPEHEESISPNPTQKPNSPLNNQPLKEKP